MIKINNRQLEAKLLEILQSSYYASAEQYLESRITADHRTIKIGKKYNDHLQRIKRYT